MRNGDDTILCISLNWIIVDRYSRGILAVVPVPQAE